MLTRWGTVFLHAATRTRRSGRHDTFPLAAPLFPPAIPRRRIPAIARRARRHARPSHVRPSHVRPRPARPAHPASILRPLARERDAIQRLFPQWKWCATWPTRFPGPIRPTRAPLRREPGPARHGARPAVALVDPRAGRARGADRRDQPDGRRAGQSSRLLAGADWQGRGYMSEACEAVTGYWFETLGKPLRAKPRPTPPRAASPRNPACGCCAPRNAAMSAAAIRASCGNQPRGVAGAPQPLTPGLALRTDGRRGQPGDCAPSHASLICSRRPCSRRPRQADAYRPFAPFSRRLKAAARPG